MTRDKSTEDYYSYTRYGMRGNITRGIVVDVNDPLQSGRVKVWIPLFHGGYPQNDPTLASSYNLNEAGVSVGRLGDITNPDTISTLPWAPIMGHNWSSTSDIRTGLQNNSFGVFNIPKEGTEVYIAFEDDDVNYPIILGAVFHENDFTPSVLKTPLLEITPGTTIAANVTLDYNNIKNSYIIQSQNNYSLLISEIAGQEEIMLGGAIPITTNPTLTEFGKSYQDFTVQYPNFPTTQSAPFRVRTSTTKANIPIISQDLLQPSAVSSLTSVPDASDVGTTNLVVSPKVVNNPSITKQLPVSVAFNPPVKGQQFDYQRSTGQLHLGVDLTFNTPSRTTNLVAPIDGIVVYCRMGSTTAGNYLIFQGNDGYCHTFMHLSSVMPQVQYDANYNTGKVYTMGTLLGVTGGAVGLTSSGTHTTGAHLHWEVFNPSGQAPNQVRVWATHNNGFYPVGPKGTMIFLNPLTEWLKSSIPNVNTSIKITASQIDSVAQTYSTPANQYNYDKPIGLEISLNPGAEQTFLRGPGGAFLGFDPDGNFKLYTPGSAEFKINRNLTFDVLGGIFNSCMAIYNRARTIIKSIAGSKITANSISAFTDFPIKGTVNSSVFTNNNLPRIFKRIDDNRKTDMLDAIAQSNSNIYYTLVGGMLGQTVEAISTNGYAADPDQDIINKINFPFNDYDGYINGAWAKYIQKSNNPIASHITTKILKAMILFSSLGNIDPPSFSGGIGVCQLSLNVIKSVNGMTAQSTSYLNPQDNINTAVQFLLLRADAMVKFLGNNAIWSDDSSGFGSKEFAMRATLMDYIYCNLSGTVNTDIENLYNNVVIGGTYSFPALENSFKNSSYLDSNEDAKNYVFVYVATILTIINNPQFTSPV